MFPRAARWGHAGKMLEILRFPHVFMTASPRFPRFSSSQSSKSLRFWACWSTWVKRPEKPYLMAKLLKFKPRRWEIDLGGPGRSTLRICSVLDFLEINSVGLLSKGSKLLDCRPVAGFSGVSRPFRCKDQRNQSCWAWELTSCRSCRKKPFEIPKSLWGPYSNCRRKDGTARGVESGSALRGPFRDFGFAWHGFVDLFLLAL